MDTQYTPSKVPQRPLFNGPFGLSGCLQKWQGERVWHHMALHRTLAARCADDVPMPSCLSEQLRSALESRGIKRLYTHQSSALEWVNAGRDVIIATPTASGKSLCYHLPVLNTFAQNPDARALYLFPTKALSRDQEEGLRRLMTDAGLGHGAITYDGDTPGDARRVARQRAGVLMTNPDMLHAGILPHHTGWARFFANLKYVVIDELHMYRGVFGSHLSNVVRRLQRIARFHGSEPVFIMASATIGNPGEHAQRIIGRPVACISESGAPVGPREVLVYNPPIVNEELGLRANYQKTAVRLTADLVRAGVPTLVFGHSRTGVEVMLKYLREALKDDPIDASAIMAYRGGYLPDRRRRIEAELRSGQIRCVVATNALELGIDIGTLDAVVCAGYPGSIAALWQRFGRAGRRMSGSLALLVTSSMPLDQFFAHQPSAIVETPIEQARIDPDNIEILVQHVKCAAFELPFESGETLGAVPWETVEEALDFLAHHRVVHRVESDKGDTYHWASDVYPASDVSLRSVGWDNFVIIDIEREKTLAEMDWRSAHTMLHEQAIYQHDASQYQVESLDYENRKAFVRLVKPDYYTTAETHTTIDVVKEDEGSLMQHADAWAVPFGLGEVSIVDKVVGFKKIRFHTHENVGFGEVHLPAMQMHTSSVWMTIPEAFVVRRAEERSTIVDALRGLAKAMHMVAAASLMIDPRDLGRTLGDRDDPSGPLGSSKGTGFDPTIFIYDAIPGGIGLATRLYDDRRALVHRALQAIQRCECRRGCPSCIGPVELGGQQSIVQPASSVNRKALIIDLMSELGFNVSHQ